MASKPTWAVWDKQFKHFEDALHHAFVKSLQQGSKHVNITGFDKKGNVVVVYAIKAEHRE